MSAQSPEPRAQSPARAASVVALLVAVTAVASSQTREAAGDEGAVRALVAAYVDAREKRDPAAIGALFTADADQVNSAGDWRRGRDGIVKGTLESSARNSGARRITVKSVRFAGPGLAIVDGDYEIGPATGSGAARQMWTTFVMVRQPEGWKIAAIRNSLPTGTR
jgi:uncharacterized protein (TIGR02246 family)